MITISPPQITVRRTVLFLVFLSLPGCTMFGGDHGDEIPQQIGQTAEQDYTEADLQEDILRFASKFEAYVRSATDKIQGGTDVPELKKRALLWKIRIVPVVHAIAAGSQPQRDYLALVYLTRTMKLYLTVGDGKDIFGEQQTVAVEAAAELDKMAMDIGEEFLDPEQMQKLRTNVQAYAEKNPIRGPEFSLELARKSIQVIDQSKEFSWVSSVPLSPFGAMSGMNAIPSAIRDLSRTLWVTSHIVKHLPRLSRWQTELLLFDVENRKSVKDIVKGINSVDETSRKTGERLEASGKALIDYAFLHLAALFILVLLLLLIYRTITYLLLTPSNQADTGVES
jgi:hypothetical protein